MLKNTATKLIVFCWDVTTGLAKTGDAAQLTASYLLDFASPTDLADTSASEIDSTKFKGYYVFDLAQGETNGTYNLYACRSSTSNIACVVVPAFVHTLPATGILAPTTAGRMLDVSTGGEAGVDWANVGSPTTTVDLSGTTIKTTQKVDVDTIKTNPVVNGGTVTFPTGATLASTTNITAGTITTVTTVTNQLTGTQVAAAVWQDATGAHFTVANSIGLSLYTTGVAPGLEGGLLTAGTNTSTNNFHNYFDNQSTPISGQYVATPVYIKGILGGTFTEGAADRLATAFTTFFNVATPTGTVNLTPTVTTVTNQLTAAQVATGVWQDSTSGDFTTASSIGKCLYIANVAPGGTGGHFIAGSNAATTVNFTGNLSGSVGSVTAGVTLATAERSKLTGFTTLVQVANTGNATTNGTNLKAAILAATAGTLIKVDPGMYTVDVGSGLTIPASVTVRGAGRKATVLEYGTGLLVGIVPGNNSTLESLTLHVTFDDYALSVPGSTQVTNATVRDCDIITDNLECITIVSSAVCSVRFQDCYIQSQFEWALTANAAAHQIIWERVTTYTVANGSTTDQKSFKLSNGSILTATDCALLASEASSPGKVFDVQGASVAFLSNCHCFAGDINIASLSGYLSMTNCHFDRSKVTGTGASRLVDVMGLPASTITSGSFAAGAITAASIAADAIGASELAADAVTEIAAAVWQDTTSAHFTTASSIGKSLYTSGAVPGASGGVAIVGSAMTLSAAALDAILIESGISAGAGLTNDTGTQLTSINARQALAAILSSVAAVLAGAATSTVTTKPGGKPAGNNRLTATTDADGNRSAVALKVPD